MSARGLTAVALALGIAFAGAGCGGTLEEAADDSPAAGNPTRTPKAARSDAATCRTKATDDCTPDVRFGGSVRVDALIWKVRSVRLADTIGDQTYGLGAKADGRFVVVDLQVRSDKDESATLTGNEVQLDVGGNTYDADSDGTFAAAGEGEEPLLFEDIGPDATKSTKVVFDVPDSVLGRRMRVRFNELGFGSTHGFIDITRQLR